MSISNAVKLDTSQLEQTLYSAIKQSFSEENRPKAEASVKKILSRIPENNSDEKENMLRVLISGLIDKQSQKDNTETKNSLLAKAKKSYYIARTLNQNCKSQTNRNELIEK